MQHSEIKCKFYRDAVNIVAVFISSFCCRNQRTRIKKKTEWNRISWEKRCLFAVYLQCISFVSWFCYFAKSLTALLCWISRCVCSLIFFSSWKSYISQQKFIRVSLASPMTFDWKLPLFNWKLNFFPELPKSNFLWIFLKFNHPKITSSNIVIAKKISLKWKNCLLIFEMNCNRTFVFGLSYCVGLNDPYPF